MNAGKISVTFSLIIFLSVMSFLSANTRAKDASTYHPINSTEIHSVANAAVNNTVPYYNLSWKDRMEFEKSVWGFDLKDMLILGLLFGVFFGSIKMAASYGRK